MTDPTPPPSNSEAYFRSLIGDTLDIITVTDRTSKVLFVSPAVHRILGFQPEELLGTRVFKFIHPDDFFSAIKAFGRAIRHPGTPTLHSFRHRHKDGSWRMLECIGNYVKDASGHYRVIANTRDLGDRKKAEEKLQESETRFRQLAESIQEVFWMVEPAKNQIIYISPSYEKIWGRTVESLYQNRASFIDAIHPEDRQRIVDAFPKQPLGTYDEEYRIIRPDGTLRWIRDRAFPIRNPLGTVYRFAGIAQDVTEQKQLERTVVQSEKMSAVGQLAAGIAHEINNPLGVILGFAQSMRMRIPESDALHLPVQSIEREALRCKALVQDLLTFSRERKPGALPEQPVEVIEGALHLVETQANMHKVELRKEFQSDLPLFEVDRNQIEQVVINLCTNAMDAMPQGGVLTVMLSKTPSSVQIIVKDTGTGISSDIRNRIFEPFFTTKEVGKGTGLGLSLVYEIVKKHHGEIKVDSDLGKGTAFIIQLPASTQKRSSSDNLAA